MATNDKILNGAGLSALSSQIKSYVNDKTEISVGETAPTDSKIKLWVDTSSEGIIEWDDIANKPDIPSVEGLATETYVNNKIAEVPSYTLPTATSSTLGGVKVDGSTITITDDGVISSVGGSGGSSIIVVSFPQNTVLSSEQQELVQNIIANPSNYRVFINNREVIAIHSEGTPIVFLAIYLQNIDDLEEAIFYYHEQKFIPNSFHTIINSSNIDNYISNNDWNFAEPTDQGSLYNAKELIILFTYRGSLREWYFNYKYNPDSPWGGETLSNWINCPIDCTIGDTNFSFTYDGSQFNGVADVEYKGFLYKT